MRTWLYNDLVLVKPKQTPSLLWPIGHITKLYLGGDGIFHVAIGAYVSYPSRQYIDSGVLEMDHFLTQCCPEDIPLVLTSLIKIIMQCLDLLVNYIFLSFASNFYFKVLIVRTSDLLQ